MGFITSSASRMRYLKQDIANLIASMFVFLRKRSRESSLQHSVHLLEHFAAVQLWELHLSGTCEGIVS